MNTLRKLLLLALALSPIPANAQARIKSYNVIPSTVSTDVWDLGAGKLKAQSLLVSGSPHAGYVLTSDASGNATWQVSSGGGVTIPSTGNILAGDGVGGIASTSINPTHVLITDASYANPTWLTDLDGVKITTGTLADARLSTNVPLKTGSYGNPPWITSLDASKITTGSLPSAVMPSTIPSVSFTGSVGYAVGTALTASATLGSYTVVNVDASGSSSGSIVLTLPDATTCAGRTYIVTKTDSSLHRFNLTPGTSGQTVNGLSTRAVREPSEVVNVVSNGVNWLATIRPGAFAGVVNDRLGLANFRNSLGLCGKDSVSGVGYGGVDAVLAGDSIDEGAYASTYLFDTLAHRLKLKLQARFDPSGVQGGYGFIPIVAGTNATGWPTMVNVADYNQETIDGTRLSVFRVLNSSGTLANFGAGLNGWGILGVDPLLTNTGSGTDWRLQIALDGTAANAAVKRLQATQFDTVSDVNGGSNTYPPSWDAVTNQASGYTAVAQGTGAKNGASASVTATQYGAHYTAATGLTASDRNLVQLSVSSGHYCSPTGIIAYNGDYDCGIRVHCVGRFGSLVSVTSGTGYLQAVDEWGAGQGSTDANGQTVNGAVNAKLFMSNWITNDFYSGPSDGAVATFKSTYQTYISRCLGCATKPSVLLWIPPMRRGGDATWWAKYKRALYELVEGNDNVALFDIDAMLGGGGPYEYPSGAVFQLGWQGDSYTHYDNTAQEAWASLFMRVLTGS